MIRIRLQHEYDEQELYKLSQKKSFGPISALGPCFKSSTYLSMSANRRLKLGPALILNQNPFFEIACKNYELRIDFFLHVYK